MSDDVEHENEMVECWPDGSKITVDRWRSGGEVSPWSYGKYEVYCGTCGEVVFEELSRGIAFQKYFSHAIHELQTAMMEVSYYIGQRRAGIGRNGT